MQETILQTMHYIYSRDYAPDTTGYVTDSYFTNLILINGKVNWAYIKCSTSTFRSIHAYYYPVDDLEKIGEVGIDVINGSALSFDDIYIDTAKRIGIRITGNGCYLNNIRGSFAPNDITTYIVWLNADNVTIDNVIGYSDKTVCILINSLNYTSINRVSIGNISGIMANDIICNGKLPYFFKYLGRQTGNGSFFNRNFIFFDIVPDGNNDCVCNFSVKRNNSFYYLVVNDLVTDNNQPIYKVTRKDSQGFALHVDSAENARRLLIRVYDYFS